MKMSCVDRFLARAATSGPLPPDSGFSEGEGADVRRPPRSPCETFERPRAYPSLHHPRGWPGAVLPSWAASPLPGHDGRCRAAAVVGRGLAPSGPSSTSGLAAPRARPSSGGDQACPLLASRPPALDHAAAGLRTGPGSAVAPPVSRTLLQACPACGRPAVLPTIRTAGGSERSDNHHPQRAGLTSGRRPGSREGGRWHDGLSNG